MNQTATTWRFGLVVIATSIAAIAVACGSNTNSRTTPVPATAATPMSASLAGKITVFAAASLTDAFKQIAVDFEAANPATSVEFNFGGSPALVAQLDQGATADVLATADQKNMRAALDKGLVRDAGVPFAKNRLVIIVPKSNPAAIASAMDLVKTGVKLVLAQQGVPVGDYARQSIAKLGADAGYGAAFSRKVLANVVSEEPNVKAVVTKVQLGEADAGIAYVTDVTAGVAGDVTMLPIDDQFNVIATYPIAITRHAGKRDVAQAFIDFVLSDTGQGVLKRYGFISVN
ncbi:MAG TPA: molybdate ABC transporter substrate-binding protein [Dehalococcoidia bacterium]|nr:molybdate ABC transporter substrate-binding protein [Dehalococcoidia bacterium]